MACKHFLIVTGALVAAISVFVGYAGVAGVERIVREGTVRGIQLSQSVGLLPVDEILVPGSPNARVETEVSPEMKAFHYFIVHFVRRLLKDIGSLDDLRQVGYTSYGDPEPQRLSTMEAPLDPGISTPVVNFTSSVDGYIMEADLLLPEGVADLKSAKAVVITLHGGAHVIGSRSMEFGTAGLFVHRLRDKKYAALNVRQRLMPESSPDTLIGDLVSLCKVLTDEHEFKPGEIALYGCSAGANMAIFTTLELISQGITPGAVVLSSPADIVESLNTEEYPSLDDNDEHCFLTKSFIRLAHDVVASSEQAQKLSFVKKDFTGFPPTRLILGSTDVFLDHGRAVEKNLKESGAKVEVDMPPGMWHCPTSAAGYVPEARDTVERAAKWLGEQI